VEPSFGALGGALARLLSLRRGEAVLGQRGHLELARVISLCFERGLWLFEGLQGKSVPLDDGHVRAIVALRDALRVGPPDLDVDPARARALCERRTRDPEAPPAIRGGALGLLWSQLSAEESADADRQGQAIQVLRGVARPETFGDFLAGLFALAREEVVGAQELVATIDACVTGFLRQDFLVALPALRQAFAYFPPRERLRIAETLVALGGDRSVDPSALLRTPMDVALLERAERMEQAALERARRFGLGDEHDLEASPKVGQP
jgi:hypothetical protein